MIKLVSFILLVAISAGCANTNEKNGLPYYTDADFTPQWLHAKEAATIHSIPDFSFTDQDGKL